MAKSVYEQMKSGRDEKLTKRRSPQPIYEDKKYGKGIMICAAIFMIIPIFNLIFGLIGLYKYPKGEEECKKYRRVCMAAYVIGVIMLIAGAAGASTGSSSGPRGASAAARRRTRDALLVGGAIAAGAMAGRKRNQKDQIIDVEEEIKKGKKK